MARIVQLTDLHLTAELDGRSWRANVWQNFLAALEHVRTVLEPLDFLILTGDLANQRRPETYARLRDAVASFGDRLRVLPGNHDDRELVRAAFPERLLPSSKTLNFVTRAGDFRLIGLDTLRAGRVHGRLGEQQLAWLAGELSGSSVPTLLFMHHPPVRVGTWWLDKDLLRDQEAFRRIVREGPVRGIFCGHVHQETASRLDDAEVWTTPATAYQFRPHSLVPHWLLRTPAAFRVIDLDGERVSTRVIRL